MTRVEVHAGEKYPHLRVRPADDLSDAEDVYDLPDDLIAAQKAAANAVLAAEKAIAQHMTATGQAGGRTDIWIHQLAD